MTSIQPKHFLGITHTMAPVTKTDKQGNLYLIEKEEVKGWVEAGDKYELTLAQKCAQKYGELANARRRTKEPPVYGEKIVSPEAKIRIMIASAEELRGGENFPPFEGEVVLTANETSTVYGESYDLFREYEGKCKSRQVKIESPTITEWRKNLGLAEIPLSIIFGRKSPLETDTDTILNAKTELDTPTRKKAFEKLETWLNSLPKEELTPDMLHAAVTKYWCDQMLSIVAGEFKENYREERFDLNTEKLLNKKIYPSKAPQYSLYVPTDFCYTLTGSYPPETIKGKVPTSLRTFLAEIPVWLCLRAMPNRLRHLPATLSTFATGIFEGKYEDPKKDVDAYGWGEIIELLLDRGVIPHKNSVWNTSLWGVQHTCIGRLKEVYDEHQSTLEETFSSSTDMDTSKLFSKGLSNQEALTLVRNIPASQLKADMLEEALKNRQNAAALHILMQGVVPHQLTSCGVDKPLHKIIQMAGGADQVNKIAALSREVQSKFNFKLTFPELFHSALYRNQMKTCTTEEETIAHISKFPDDLLKDDYQGLYNGAVRKGWTRMASYIACQSHVTKKTLEELIKEQEENELLDKEIRESTTLELTRGECRILRGDYEAAKRHRKESDEVAPSDSGSDSWDDFT